MWRKEVVVTFAKQPTVPPIVALNSVSLVECVYSDRPMIEAPPVVPSNEPDKCANPSHRNLVFPDIWDEMRPVRSNQVFVVVWWCVRRRHL